MRRLMVWLGVLATVSVCAAPAAPAKVPAGFVGMSADGPLLSSRVSLPRELGLMVGSGVQSVRVSFEWDLAQPRRDGPISFAQTDRVVAAAAARRITVLPVIINAPSWDALPTSYGGSQPADPAPYARYAAALVARYGPAGAFWTGHPTLPRLPIRSWQIWNEPNVKLYWRQPFDNTYTALLKAAHDAIKAADPGAKIVLAGLPNDSWNALVHLYVAGARPYFDIVAVHPYTKGVGGLQRIFRYVRKAMAHFGDARKPIVVSEFGWTSAKGKVPKAAESFNDVTAEQQSHQVAKAFRLLASVRTRYRILAAYWYTWLSTDRGSYYWNYSGLRTTAGNRPRAKPAFAAFKQVALALEGCRTKNRGDRCAR